MTGKFDRTLILQISKISSYDWLLLPIGQNWQVAVL